MLAGLKWATEGSPCMGEVSFANMDFSDNRGPQCLVFDHFCSLKVTKTKLPIVAMKWDICMYLLQYPALK